MKRFKALLLIGLLGLPQLASSCGGGDTTNLGTNGDGAPDGNSAAGAAGASTGGAQSKAGSGGQDASTSAGGSPAGGSGASGTGGLSGGTGGAAVAGTGGASAGTGGAAGAGTGGASAGTGGAAGAGTGGTLGGTGGAAGAGTGGAAGAGTGGTGGLGGAPPTGGTGGAGGAPGCLSDTDCSDGLKCTGVEKCVSGACQPGVPVVCPDDGYSCTANFCSEADGLCKSVKQDSVCPTQNCYIQRCNPTGAGRDPTTGCTKTPIVCNDGFACTVDTCNPTNGQCVYSPDNSQCDDLQFCNGTETCDPPTSPDASGCVDGPVPNCDDGIPCTTTACNEFIKGCSVTKTDDTPCQNGIKCDGKEICDPSLGCTPGTAVSCTQDLIDCTNNACNETAGTCQVTYDHSKCTLGTLCTDAGCTAQGCSNNTQCQDGKVCNGTEQCVSGTCQPGTAPSCADSVGCTLDYCDEAAPGDHCVHQPLNGVCDDGDKCNGQETCNTTTGCVAGTALVCPDDAYTCTQKGCDPVLGCVQTKINSVCNDNLVCNGAERCDPSDINANPTTGCVGGTTVICPADPFPCTTEVCQEPGGCVSVPDDTKCTSPQTCSPTQGCGNFCTVKPCQGKVYQCGDCLDNDCDGKTDSADSSCIGACSNNETGFFGDIPGQNSAPCKQDCYFDNDTGAGNDSCYWSHECDSLEVAPKYDPEGNKCKYDPGASLPGTSLTCAEAHDTQSQTCLNICGPLVPNGCDCFGCCVVPGSPTPVWLGSQNGTSNPATCDGISHPGSCTASTLTDPNKCRPCTQVVACLNPCDNCEICIGKPNLPPECTVQTCPVNQEPCGLPGQAPCPSNKFCITGCCVPLPT